MVEQKGRDLTSSHGHTKTTSTYRTILRINDLKTSITALPQLKIKRKSHSETSGMCRDALRSRPTSLAWQLTGVRDITNAEVLPKEFQAPYQESLPCGPVPGRQASIYLALNSSGA